MTDTRPEDFFTSAAALADAVRWAFGLTDSDDIQSISFGRRKGGVRGWYWYAVTYTRWSNSAPDAHGVQDFASRVGKIAAAWAEGVEAADV